MVGRERDVLAPVEKARAVRTAIESATGKKHIREAQIILLSGGLDSSICASLLPKIPTYTISLEGTRLYSDLRFAGRLVKHLRTEDLWHPIVVTEKEAAAGLRPIINITQSYDTALLNDLALIIAIQRAQEGLGKDITVISGEPADNFFRGYHHTYEMSERRLVKDIDNITAETLPLAPFEKALGIRAVYPYLEPEVKDVARRFKRKEDNIIYRNKPGGVWDTHPDNPKRETGAPYPFGKFLLRAATADILPPVTSMRMKTDIQFGSGMVALESYLESMVAPEELASYKDEGLHLRSKSHAGMLWLLRDENVRLRKPGKNEYPCHWCKSGVRNGSHHCRTCGGYPADATHEEFQVMLRRGLILF